MSHIVLDIDLDLLAPLQTKYQGAGRDKLLPMLHEIQAQYGWLPREAQIAASETLRIPLADIHGVIEFYSMFYNEPNGRTVVRVCEDLACQVAGIHSLRRQIEAEFELVSGETEFDRDISLEYVPCLGLCNQAPAALFGDNPLGGLTVATVARDRLAEARIEEDFIGGNADVCTGLIRDKAMTNLADYENHGGFAMLKSYIRQGQEAILDLIDQTGILGRGGALFPLGRKLRFTHDAPGTSKHIVVNADESEPGTFKDRILMETNPFAVIEAAIISAYAIGATSGWIFIRGEYPRSIKIMSDAVNTCRRAGYLGKSILGRKGFDFDIEIRVGAGAYICGEETALFEAIEGKRGFPRIKPPFPVTKGLFNEPTAINNVETLVASLAALQIGIDRWRQFGTNESPGTKLFCLSGQVVRPGLYEVSFGTTIRELLEMGGGVPYQRPVKTILMGGAAGAFITPDLLDMPLTYEDARMNGIPLGSGVVMVLDDSVDLRQFVSRIGEFFVHESCGKCFPCQLGTQRQAEILHRIVVNKTASRAEVTALIEIGQAMNETSLCGLGQTAASAVLSAINLWPELFE